MTDPTPQTTTRDEAVLSVDALAQEIRRVDGSHSLGAGALAEALMPFLLASAPAPASGGVGAVATEPPYRPLEDFLDWAGGRWEVEVKNRPLNNVHRRALDTTWRQVIRKLGADPEALFGPAHDDLVEAQQASTAAPKLSLSDDDREIIASAIRSALSPAATPVSEAEPVYISRSTLRYLLDGMRLASVYVSKHPNMDDPVALYALSKPAGGDVVRCLATGNPVGTDTWQVGRPCRCANCSPLSQSTSAGRGGE